MNDDVTRAALAAVSDGPEVLEAWARIPSGSGDEAGLEAMCEAIAERAAALPGTIEAVPLTGGGSALRIRHRPEAIRRVLLVGHFDTVHDEAFPGPPVGRPEPDVLRGPGVADMKGGILVLLAGLAGLEASPEAEGLGWEVLLTPDEELGAPRSLPVLRDSARRADVGLVFEPAADGGHVVVARRGREVLAIDVAGRAAHAGRDPWAGRSAVAALAEMTLAAEALGSREAGVSVNVGVVAGGGAVNVIPDRARADVDVRATSADDLAAVHDALTATAAEVSARREVIVQVTRVIGCPPMAATDWSRALAGAYADGAAGLGLTVRAAEVGGVSDGNHLAAEGVPVLDGLGVVGGGLHGPDEWVHLPSIAQRAAAAALLLHGLARSI